MLITYIHVHYGRSHSLIMIIVGPSTGGCQSTNTKFTAPCGVIVWKALYFLFYCFWRFIKGVDMTGGSLLTPRCWLLLFSVDENFLFVLITKTGFIVERGAVGEDLLESHYYINWMNALNYINRPCSHVISWQSRVLSLWWCCYWQLISL